MTSSGSKTAMAVPRVLRLLLVAALTAGCKAATPEPVTREAAETPALPPSKPSPQEPAAPAPPAPQEAKPARDDDPVVVDSGGDGAPPTLMEAAKAERERRAGAGKPVAVINDKTLAGYARKGQITIADPKKDKKDAAPAEELAPQDFRDEAYWRNRGLDIRERWRDAAGDVKDLEQKATVLRRNSTWRATPSPGTTRSSPSGTASSNSSGRPAWTWRSTQKELTEFLEEGRVADVIPGWLREGEDEEPEELPKKKEAGAPQQSIEPPVVEPPPAVDPPLSRWIP